MNNWSISHIVKNLLPITLCSLFSISAHAENTEITPIEKGKSIASELCQACHEFKGADQAGTVGPPLVNMSQRFPKRERLREIIYDPQKASKPHTMMPPFGRHGFLDKEQTEQLIEFLYTL